MHIYHVICMGDFQPLRKVLNLMLSHDAQDFFAPAYQRHFGSEVPMRFQSAQNCGLRSQISAHRVENDFHGETPLFA